jgi:hypothetical protein
MVRVELYGHSLDGLWGRCYVFLDLKQGKVRYMVCYISVSAA